MKWFGTSLGLVGGGAIAAGIFLGLAGWPWHAPLVAVPTLAGLVLVLIWVLTHLSQLRALVGLRSTQSNLNVFVSVIAVAVILGAINLLAARYSVQFDLTEARLFSLAPQTETVVRELSQPIQISVVSDMPSANLRRRLEQYRRLNPDRVQIEFVNPRSNPIRTEQLQVSANNTIVVTAGDRQQQFPQPNPLSLEVSLTPILLQLTSEGDRTIYFVQGHGELPLEVSGNRPAMSQAIEALDAEGFETEPLNLIASATVPADAAAVVVAAPQQAWLPAEVERLQAYLKEGGRLLLMVNPFSDPQLDSLLQDWGIELANDVLVEASPVSQVFGAGPTVALVTRYGDHPITTPLVDGGLVTFFPFARSLSAVEGIEATPLLSTSDESWGESDLDNPQLQFDPENGDRLGPLTLGLAIVRPVIEDIAEDPAEAASQPEVPEGSAAAREEAPAREARLVAIGNAGFVSDGAIAQLGNRDLFLNTINWLADRNAAITIRPKSPTNRRFNLTITDLQWLRLFSAIVLPAFALSMAGYLWWQRR
ncbi:Gldg family protein [Synechococcus sp. PCC 7336]|uniref:GldG family protein n=1 Tax=Synechococcus sp. PCC 7336 TaxID=195250 RepID=UPI000346D269|nr:Gldg family protein [Synechococcus sp. PCC 7336]